jgi:hypothetical protein
MSLGEGGPFGVQSSLTIDIAPTPDSIRRAFDEEVKLGYTPLPHLCVVGGLAAVFVCLIPVLIMVLNLLIALVSGVKGASLGRYLLPLLVQPAFLTWVLFCVTFGIGNALARCWSVRTGRFWWINTRSPIRLGLDDLLSIAIGPIFLAWAMLASGVGPLFWYLLAASPVPAYICHALWESIYAPLLRRFGHVTHNARIKHVITTLKNDSKVLELGRIVDHEYSLETRTLEIRIWAESEEAEGVIRRVCTESYLVNLPIESIRIKRLPM